MKLINNEDLRHWLLLRLAVKNLIAILQEKRRRERQRFICAPGFFLNHFIIALAFQPSVYTQGIGKTPRFASTSVLQHAFPPRYHANPCTPERESYFRFANSHGSRTIAYNMDKRFAHSIGSLYFVSACSHSLRLWSLMLHPKCTRFYVVYYMYVLWWWNSCENCGHRWSDVNKCRDLYQGWGNVLYGLIFCHAWFSLSQLISLLFTFELIQKHVANLIDTLVGYV